MERVVFPMFIWLNWTGIEHIPVNNSYQSSVVPEWEQNVSLVLITYAPIINYAEYWTVSQQCVLGNRITSFYNFTGVLIIWDGVDRNQFWRRWLTFFFEWHRNNVLFQVSSHELISNYSNYPDILPQAHRKSPVSLYKFVFETLLWNITLPHNSCITVTHLLCE